MQFGRGNIMEPPNKTHDNPSACLHLFGTQKRSGTPFVRITVVTREWPSLPSAKVGRWAHKSSHHCPIVAIGLTNFGLKNPTSSW